MNGGQDDTVRTTEEPLAAVHYAVTEREAANRVFRCSLLVGQDIEAGETFTEQNIRSMRPGNGLHTRYPDQALGQRASQDIVLGTPLGWAHLSAG
jgi:pseudaminic acid synthase